MHYALENLKQAGITQVGVVVSPENQADIRQALSHIQEVNITFLVQEQPQGLAHAVGVARQWLANEPFVLYLGDNLFQKGITRFVQAFDGTDAVIALVKVPDPRQFGVAVLEGGRIVRLVEKPQDPPSSLAVAGVYVFSPLIHDIIAQLKPSPRGEYEITDAIQVLIEQQKHVVGVEIEGWWKDTGRPPDLLDANRLLLVELQPESKGQVWESQITGRVVIEEGAVVRQSTILGPALIAKGAIVDRAYVGPFTSVGPGAVVRGTEIEYSILEDGAVVEDVPLRLHECILGVGAKATSRNGLPKAHKLVLGDESVVELA